MDAPRACGRSSARRFARDHGTPREVDVASDRRRGYGGERGRGARERAATMAPEKEGGRTRRKAGAAGGEGGRAGRRVEGEVGQGGGVTRADIGPWGSFFEKFWEQAAEGGSVDRHDGGQEPAKDARAVGTKPGKRGRTSRVS